MKYKSVNNFIGKELVEGGGEKLDVCSPLDGSVISQVILSTSDAVDKAVQTAKAAFPSWSETPIKERVQVFFRYKRLFEENMDELTKLVQEENGKTYDEAKAEVLKSAELTEFASSMPQLISGELLEVSKDVERRVEYFPLGVVASISPLISLTWFQTGQSQMRWYSVTR